MTGIFPSSSGAAPLAPPPEPPAAEGHGDSAVTDDNTNSTLFPLLDLLERFPDLFAHKVLAHLDPIDRTFVAQVGSACRTTVAASGLPRAGTRGVVMGRSVWVVTHKLKEFCTSVARLAWAKASGCPWVEWTCVLTSLGAGTWMCCGGRGRTTARGIPGRASAPLGVGTWRC
jgi:hypothetical protein